MIEPPAVLVGITGQGRTRGMATLLMTKATINQHIAFIKPHNSRASVQYLHRFFQMAYRQIRDDSEGAGSTKGAVTCDQIERLRVPLPPPNEQTEILSCLKRVTQTYDSLESEAERAITLLQERRTALISAAVTGKIDVRGWANDGERDA
jgi:type I restriction enzyme S subunit